jgi:O-antigen/teichoic acid export membrane protein
LHVSEDPGVRTASVGKGTLFSLTSQVGSLLTTFLSGVIIARVLGTSGKGTYSLVVLTYAFMVLIGNFGVPVFVASTIGRRKHSIGALLQNSLAIFASSAVLVVILFLALRGRLHQSEVLGPFLVLLVVVIPVGLLREHLAAFLQGRGQIGRFSLTRIVGQLATLCLLVVFLSVRLDIWVALYCWVAGEVVSLAVTLVLLRPVSLSEARFSSSLLRESVGFGGAVWLGNLVALASLRLDRYLVAYFLDASAVGLYSVAATVASFILFLPNAMAIALLPRFSSATGEESYEFAGRACRIAVLWGVGCAVILAAVGGVLIRAIYGDAFASSARAMVLLLPGTIFCGMGYVTSAYFMGATRKPLIIAALAAVSLVVGIGLDLFLIPALGISGAAISSSAAYLFSMVVTLAVFARVSGRSSVALVAVRKSDFSELARFVLSILRLQAR